MIYMMMLTCLLLLAAHIVEIAAIKPPTTAP